MPAASQTSYVIRPCTEIGELEACVRLQKQIWGYAEGESYPTRLFVNLTHIGGHVIGAFAARRRDVGELVGFVAGMPGWRGGKRYLHSLSLGVARGHENQGLGRKLKLEQRERTLEAGVRWMEWTFDPMRSKNAFFNIARLGAIVRRYQPDYYGRVDSRLQQGLPSDRLICEWWLKSARVRRALEGRPARSKRKPAAEIEILVDFAVLAAQEPNEARRLQQSVRRKFESCFRRGLAVVGFERGNGVGRYLLGALDES